MQILTALNLFAGLWKDHQDRQRARDAVELEQHRQAAQQRKEAAEINEAVDRLRPGDIPERMRRYQRD